MSRTNLRLVALGVTLLTALGSQTLQPDNLALFGNPKLVAYIIGLAMVFANVVSNWLPSMTNITAGEKPPST